MTHTIHHGDCLDVLRQMPDNSVDAICCDPPYGLSNTSPDKVTETIVRWAQGDREYLPSDPRKGRKNCLTEIIRRHELEADNGDPGSLQDLVNLSITLDPSWLAVLGSVDLDNDAALGEVEVHDVSPALALNDVLVKDLLANLGQHGEDVEFRLRARKGGPGCVGECTCFAELSQSVTRVGVRLGYYTLADTEGPTPVVALRTTEVRAVLSFDVRGATAELTPAGPAVHDDLFTLLISPKPVGACAGARSLAAVAEASGVSGVSGAADGAITLDLVTHEDLLDRFFRPNNTPVGFMGASWDAFVPPVAVWDECFRVLKPGGHLVAFAGSRTHDLMGVGIRMAGFEIRDSLMWVQGAGFPKSLDISKAIDKLDATDERRVRALEFTTWMRSTGITSAQVDEITGTNMGGHFLTTASQPAVATADLFDKLRPHLPEVPARIEELVAERTVESQNYAARPITQIGKGEHQPGETIKFDQRSSTDRERRDIPTTPEAEKWKGWGTSLKPSVEPISLARKPLSEKTVAANTLTWGTGGLNIDATRIGTQQGDDLFRSRVGGFSDSPVYGKGVTGMREAPAAGRWPANVILDPDTAKALDQQSGNRPGFKSQNDHKETQSNYFGADKHPGERQGYNDEGGASRFFKVVEPDPPFMYAAKAPKKERPRYEDEQGNVIQHPTTKPLSIMKWLVRLTCPPGGTILDPFAGSGTTIEAAMLEGFNVIGIEREAEYLPLIQQRIDRANDTLPIAS